MAHKVQIEVSIKTDRDQEKEKEKNSDLAPKVLDSEEPGVDKGNMGGRFGAEQVESLLNATPESMGKGTPMTLNDRARKKMGDRLGELKKKV